MRRSPCGPMRSGANADATTAHTCKTGMKRNVSCRARWSNRPTRRPAVNGSLGPKKVSGILNVGKIPDAFLEPTSHDPGVRFVPLSGFPAEPPGSALETGCDYPGGCCHRAPANGYRLRT